MLALYRSRRRAAIVWLWLAAAVSWLAWRVSPVHGDIRAASVVAAPLALLLLVPICRATLDRARSVPALRSSTLVLGSGALAECCIDIARKARDPALHYVGRLLPDGESYFWQPDDSLGTFGDLDRVVFRHRVRRIVVCSGERRGHLPVDRLLELKFRGVRIEEGVDFYERMTGRIFVRELRASQLVFADGFFTPRKTFLAKRVLDLVGASIGLILAAPLMLLTAIAIKLDSKGPVFYSQERAGAFGKPFVMHKFRSMHVDAEADGARFASVSDPRVTRVGRFIRRTRIDELPQLWNVLTSEMSLVGPRPERPQFITNLEREIPYFRQRLFVKPGVTGWAQVRCSYGATIEEQREKLEHDLFYIKKMSLRFDLSILISTVRVVLLRIGSR